MEVVLFLSCGPKGSFPAAMVKPRDAMSDDVFRQVYGHILDIGLDFLLRGDNYPSFNVMWVTFVEKILADGKSQHTRVQGRWGNQEITTFDTKIANYLSFKVSFKLLLLLLYYYFLQMMLFSFIREAAR